MNPYDAAIYINMPCEATDGDSRVLRLDSAPSAGSLHPAENLGITYASTNNLITANATTTHVMVAYTATSPTTWTGDVFTVTVGNGTNDVTGYVYLLPLESTPSNPPDQTVTITEDSFVMLSSFAFFFSSHPLSSPLSLPLSPPPFYRP